SSLCLIFVLICFFFFSSRRRHTRSKRDWSSDVCSSDLRNGPQGSGIGEEVSFTLNTIDRHAVAFSQDAYDKYTENDKGSSLRARSEERRVGKECRSRGWVNHEKKKSEKNNETEEKHGYD